MYTIHDRCLACPDNNRDGAMALLYTVLAWLAICGVLWLITQVAPRL